MLLDSMVSESLWNGMRGSRQDIEYGVLFAGLWCFGFWSAGVIVSCVWCFVDWDLSFLVIWSCIARFGAGAGGGPYMSGGRGCFLCACMWIGRFGSMEWISMGDDGLYVATEVKLNDGIDCAVCMSIRGSVGTSPGPSARDDEIDPGTDGSRELGDKCAWGCTWVLAGIHKWGIIYNGGAPELVIHNGGFLG